MRECLERFTALWHERASRPPREPLDLVTLLAQNPATRGMQPMDYLGNLLLLIVGGNDTTRHSLSGGVLALHENPAELAKLRADPGLVNSLVPEIIRWQTPLAYMRRTAVTDVELAGQKIRAGEKVLMWYLSGNRDLSEIPDADRFVVDRAQPRHHLGFGFGIHRCMGNRLAEMQLRIAWEEILKRFSRIEVCGVPVRVMSSFVHGFEKLLVRVHAA
jgi:cytochrome P450